jgi:hypothetical protein
MGGAPWSGGVYLVYLSTSPPPTYRVPMPPGVESEGRGP